MCSTYCSTSRVAERSGSSPKGFRRAFNEGHHAFGGLSPMKVSSLSRGFQQKSACFGLLLILEEKNGLGFREKLKKRSG